MNRAIECAAFLGLMLAPLAMAQGQTAPAGAAPAGASAAPVTRSEVKNAQRELKAEGLYKGKVDGIAGPQTNEAVSIYEKKHGLPQTAGLDQETARRIGGPRGRRAWRGGRGA